MKTKRNSTMRFLLFPMLFLCIAIVAFWPRTATVTASVSTVPAPAPQQSPEEVYTGTIVSMQGRMVSTGFTLYLKSYTSDEDFSRYLGILAEGDQFDVLKNIRDINVGNLVPTRDVARRVNVARKTQLADGRTRIVVAFERWLKFAEVRNGYRSQDYPFGIMEIILDGKGKGSGTFIAACAIDIKTDKKTGQNRLELESFGTYPNKVMGVMDRTKKSSAAE